MSIKQLLQANGHDSVESALEELMRFKSTIRDYTHWLGEFPDVSTVLWNLEVTAAGKTPLCSSHPPSNTGPWSTQSLREVLRERTKR
jgi:hypothetical protein